MNESIEKEIRCKSLPVNLNIGLYEDGVFHVDALGCPPAEPPQVTRWVIGHDFTEAPSCSGWW